MVRTWCTLALVLTVGCSKPPAGRGLPGGGLVDLSHAYDAQSIFWPTADPFRLERVADGITPAGYYYAANNMAAAEHGGTHFDAPVHFAEGMHTTDQIPLEQLVGPAVVVDATRQAEADRDYRVRVPDLEAWEHDHGRIPEGAIVLFRTGRGAWWPDRARYLGTARTGPDAVPELHFPGLDSATARLLVARGVRAVGIDTPIIDYGQSVTFDAHQVLAGADVPIFENVASLDRLPVTGSYLVALPMKIGGGSGGPLRIAAWVPVD